LLGYDFRCEKSGLRKIGGISTALTDPVKYVTLKKDIRKLVEY